MKHVGVLVLTLTIGCVAFAQNRASRIVDLKAALVTNWIQTTVTLVAGGSIWDDSWADAG